VSDLTTCPDVNVTWGAAMGKVLRWSNALPSCAVVAMFACSSPNPQQFDLVCSGSIKVSRGSSLGLTDRYTFDLDRRLFRDPDEQTWPITAVTDGQIIVEKGTKFSREKTFRLTFDRQTLTWTQEWIDDPEGTLRGQCSREAYTSI